MSGVVVDLTTKGLRPRREDCHLFPYRSRLVERQDARGQSIDNSMSNASSIMKANCWPVNRSLSRLVKSARRTGGSWR